MHNISNGVRKIIQRYHIAPFYLLIYLEYFGIAEF